MPLHKGTGLDEHVAIYRDGQILFFGMQQKHVTQCCRIGHGKSIFANAPSQEREHFDERHGGDDDDIRRFRIRHATDPC